MNQGTFSDYHDVHPYAAGVNGIGILITGSNYDGRYNVNSYYGPAAGIYHSELFNGEANQWICSRLSKN